MVSYAALQAGHPFETRIMKYDRLTVGRKLHVQFDAVAGFAGRLEGADGVFRRAVNRPKTAMSNCGREKALPGLAKRGVHAVSTMASTSTAKPRGKR